MTIRPNRRIRPMLVDNTLNLATAAIYFIYAAFGLVGAVIDTVPPLYQVAGEGPSRVLGLIIFLSGLLASISSLHSLTNNRWERWEFYSTSTLVTFMAVHVGVLFYLSASSDPARLSYAIVATSLLVMPTWKIAHILKKNRR